MERPTLRHGPGKRRKGQLPDEQREHRLCRKNFLKGVGAVRSRNVRTRLDLGAIRHLIVRSEQRKANNYTPDGPETGRTIGGSISGAGRKEFSTLVLTFPVPTSNFFLVASCGSLETTEALHMARLTRWALHPSIR